MSAYYLESSAVIKLFIQEAETKELIEWLGRNKPSGDHGFVTSELTRLEVLGKLAQLGINLEPAIKFFNAVTLVPVKRNLLELAVSSRLLGLKTLDSIHHATAQWLASDLEGVVCYDQQLVTALKVSGLLVHSPGAIQAS